MRTYTILVAGYAYYRSADFAGLAKNRVNYLIDRNPGWATDTDVEFLLFDVKTGTILKNAVTGGTRSWQVESTAFEAIDHNAHYSERTFIAAANRVISITDAYDHIINIGRSEPGTVREFSILGHGYWNGPILVNSCERPDYRSDGSRAYERDPLDKDGRRKDGNLLNMPDDEWEKFYRAFRKDACCWVWGCNFYVPVLRVMQKTITAGGRRLSSMQDGSEIQLQFTQDWANEYYGDVPLFFPAVGAAGRVNRADLTFTRTFGQIKQLCKIVTLHSYAGLMAYNTRLPFRAALPGTYSDYERGPANSRHRVMLVPRSSTIYSDNFTSIIRFYQDHLGLETDPEGRGYGVFTPEKMSDWWKALNEGLV
ncbi:MAG: hypothetical protein R2824_01815 [Saprospiraceae bacterium]|nr:hypothetical protein [Lewinella sp.]